jgi:hypothetical protein
MEYAANVGMKIRKEGIDLINWIVGSLIIIEMILIIALNIRKIKSGKCSCS